MVRKKFADAIRQEALEAIVRDAYKEVVEKQDLKVASQPHVHDLKFEEGKPLTFEIHFELRPTVDLARLGFPRDKAQYPSSPTRTSRTRSSRSVTSVPPGPRRWQAHAGRHGERRDLHRRRRVTPLKQARIRSSLGRTGYSGHRRADHGSAPGRDGRATRQMARRFP